MLPGTFSPPYRGSLAQAHHRLKRTTWQLARTRAAKKVRNNLSLLSRVAVPYTRPFFTKDARKMQEKEYKEFIKVIEICIKRHNNKR
jgi:hypothetical protein